MANAPISFANNLESGFDSIGGASPSAHNVVVDGKGTVYRRPGLASYSEAPSTTLSSYGVGGIYATSTGLLYAVAGKAPTRKLYIVRNGTANLLLGASGGSLNGALRPVFAETEALVVIAAGSFMEKIELATNESSRLGGNPPRASHVVAQASRLLANDMVVDRSKLRYSGVAIGTVYTGNEDWSLGGFGLGGFFTAEARPDPVQAVYDGLGEVQVFGTTSIQAYVPDAQQVFAPATSRDIGLQAPYSVVRVDQAFAWLDNYRRFVISDGRSQETISDPIGTVLDAISDPSDCFGYVARVGLADVIVWTFPSANVTYAYQIRAGWAQWSSRNQLSGSWDRFPVECLTVRHSTGEHVVGLQDGRIARLAEGVADDLGVPIVASVKTGYENRGTSARKRCIAVRLSFGAGVSDEDTGNPVGFLRWSDIQGQWSTPRAVYLTTASPRGPVAILRSLGVYRMRAWEFEFAGALKLALASVEEEFEILSD